MEMVEMGIAELSEDTLWNVNSPIRGCRKK